ncbi:hypothetical protein ABTY98_40560 [Streptomyces sp. NPDC096040]|uniref:hypothetical protein n=1 Tax=Streptomyces sp. NPDC096040 TaxID=3155541 RepID=UPI00333001B6
MDASLMQSVVADLSRVLPELTREARERQSSPEITGDQPGWHAYAPLGSDASPFQPPTPWGRAEVLGVGAVGQLIIVSFRWLPAKRLFAHVTDLGAWDAMPDVAALQIEHALTRMLASDEFPDLPKALEVGDITLVRGLAFSGQASDRLFHPAIRNFSYSTWTSRGGR